MPSVVINTKNVKMKDTIPDLKECTTCVCVSVHRG